MNQLKLTQPTSSNSYNQFLEIDFIVSDYLNYVFTYMSTDTYLCYKGHLDQIIEYFKSTYNLKYDIDLKNEHIYSFIQFQKSKKLSEKTINKRINVLKRAFRYCKSITNLEDVKTLKEKYVRFNCLESHDIKKLVEYITTSKMSLQNKLMLSLFLESGVRRKELVNIEVSNIDFENKGIFLTITKGNKPRYVCYNDLTSRYIDDYIKLYKPKKFLFDLTYVSISNVFRRIQQTLNFKSFSPYVLRHSYATIIVNNDGNMEMLRQTMGHEKLTTTQIYIHYNKKFINTSYQKSFKLNRN